MAAALPAKLRAAAPDVQRFARRATELATFRPIVTYWCEYYVLRQVLDRQLHTVDEECTNYAIQLMDKLEAYKKDHADNDAVVDDLAAKAYIENFALETFARGDEAQRTNKVTRQTADTFQAAGTFLDLLGIWGPLDAEASAKTKFAKFHALRIAKAIKAGEDPNATNPVVEPPPTALESEPNVDAEWKELEAEIDNKNFSTYKPPTAEGVSDSEMPPLSDVAQDLPSRQPAFEPPPPPPPQHTEHDVSPLDPPNEATSRTGSVGGGYFPSAPPDLPSPAAHVPSADPAAFYTSAPSQSLPDTPAAAPAPSIAPLPASAPFVPMPSVAPPPAVVSQVPLSAGPPPVGGFKTDDESILAAQKHAKWAISALNFEDVETAVKELRIALHALGAS